MQRELQRNSLTQRPGTQERNKYIKEGILYESPAPFDHMPAAFKKLLGQRESVIMNEDKEQVQESQARGRAGAIQVFQSGPRPTTTSATVKPRSSLKKKSLTSRERTYDTHQRGATMAHSRNLAEQAKKKQIQYTAIPIKTEPYPELEMQKSVEKQRPLSRQFSEKTTRSFLPKTVNMLSNSTLHHIQDMEHFSENSMSGFLGNLLTSKATTENRVVSSSVLQFQRLYGRESRLPSRQNNFIFASSGRQLSDSMRKKYNSQGRTGILRSKEATRVQSRQQDKTALITFINQKLNEREMKYATAIRDVMKTEKPYLMKTEQFNYTEIPTITVSRGTPKSISSEFSKTALKPINFNHHESFLDTPTNGRNPKNSPQRSARLAKIDLNLQSSPPEYAAPMVERFPSPHKPLQIRFQNKEGLVKITGFPEAKPIMRSLPSPGDKGMAAMSMAPGESLSHLKKARKISLIHGRMGQNSIKGWDVDPEEDDTMIGPVDHTVAQGWLQETVNETHQLE